MTEVQDIQPKGKRMTRRTVAQGAAWAVPVIAIGAPVPAMAASPPDVVFELDPLLSCKYPGKSCSDFDFGYRLVFRVRSTLAVILFISAFTAPNGDQVTVLNVDGEPGPDGGIIANDTERNVAVVIGSANSANGTATITLTTQTGEVIIRTVTISDFHPCDQDLRGLCP